jgi:hypothetical protein
VIGNTDAFVPDPEFRGLYQRVQAVAEAEPKAAGQAGG